MQARLIQWLVNQLSLRKHPGVLALRLRIEHSQTEAVLCQAGHCASRSGGGLKENWALATPLPNRWPPAGSAPAPPLGNGCWPFAGNHDERRRPTQAHCKDADSPVHNKQAPAWRGPVRSRMKQPCGGVTSATTPPTSLGWPRSRPWPPHRPSSRLPPHPRSSGSDRRCRNSYS